MSKNVVETEGPQEMSQYGVYALHAGKVRLHARTLMHTPTRRVPTRTRTQTNMLYLLLFHGNSGFANAPQCYVIRTLSLLLFI
jgi:hypothetical protein